LEKAGDQTPSTTQPLNNDLTMQLLTKDAIQVKPKLNDPTIQILVMNTYISHVFQLLNTKAYFSIVIQRFKEYF